MDSIEVIYMITYPSIKITYKFLRGKCSSMPALTSVTLFPFTIVMISIETNIINHMEAKPKKILYICTPGNNSRLKKEGTKAAIKNRSLININPISLNNYLLKLAKLKEKRDIRHYTWPSDAYRRVTYQRRKLQLKLKYYSSKEVFQQSIRYNSKKGNQRDDQYSM